MQVEMEIGAGDEHKILDYFRGMDPCTWPDKKMATV
jgi:hypothetical protein